MALIIKLVPDIVKIDQHTKNEVSMSRYLKVAAQIVRQTHRQNKNITLPHKQMVHLSDFYGQQRTKSDIISNKVFILIRKQ